MSSRCGCLATAIVQYTLSDTCRINNCCQCVALHAHQGNIVVLGELYSRHYLVLPAHCITKGSRVVYRESGSKHYISLIHGL